MNTPFSAGAGQLLDKMLIRAGINRRDVFTTMLVHTPHDKDFSDFYKPSKQLILAMGVLQLKKDIEEIQPNIILALGQHSLKVLTGKAGLDKWRGSILPSTLVKDRKVMGTYNPVEILKVYDYKSVGEFDLIRGKKEASSPTIRYPERTIYLPNNYVTWRDGIEWKLEQRFTDVESLIYKMLDSGEPMSVDIECTPTPLGGWELSCIGFCTDPKFAVVIDARSGSGMRLIKTVCEHPIHKVMQNGMFDTTVLREAGIFVSNFTYDTMIAHHTLFAESASGTDEMASLTGKKRQAAFAKGLGFQTSIYTNEPFYKDDGKLWKIDGDYNTFYRYNGLDCCVTKEIQLAQQVELDLNKGAQDHFTHAMQLVEPVMKATRKGLKVDLKARDEMKVEYELQITRLQAALNVFAGEPINVKSSPAVQTLLYTKLKLPVQYKKRKKANGTYENTPSADKDALNLLAAKTHNPLLLLILKIRERRDLIERYLNVQLDPDLRMRSSVDITGTRTGRLAYRASLSGSGTNLQNQPEELRRMYIADDGYLFGYADYSQAEARVVAHLARCHGLIELFDDPTRDIHCENAARIFGKRIPRLIKDGGDVTEEERYLAKRVVHASNYGMGEDRLVQIVNQDAEVTGIRIDEAKAHFLLQSYFTIYPEIKQNFWREVEGNLRYKKLTNSFGWERIFYGRIDGKSLNEAYAHVPQSDIGILCRRAWVRADKALEPLGGEVLINVHDALVSAFPVNRVDECVAAMKEAMHIPLTIHGNTFYIPVDVKVGYNWGNKGKDGSNPLGLQDIKKWKLEHASA